MSCLNALIAKLLQRRPMVALRDLDERLLHNVDERRNAPLTALPSESSAADSPSAAPEGRGQPA